MRNSHQLRTVHIHNTVVLPFAEVEEDGAAGLHQSLAHVRVPLQRLRVAVVAVVVLEVVHSLKPASKSHGWME